MKKFLLIISFIFISNFAFVSAQFDVEHYQKYLEEREGLTFDGLIQEFPTGYFFDDAVVDFDKSEYSDSVKTAFELTPYEISLIEKHGFMVSERLSYNSFIQAFWDVYHKDLPVYVSTDAILHALHYTFSSSLISIEEEILSFDLYKSIGDIRYHFIEMDKDTSNPLYKNAIMDLDIYLTISWRLINIEDLDTPSEQLAKPFYPENNDFVETIWNCIKSESPVEINLFSDNPRIIDFSQFKVRGHYTRSEILQMYFRTMTWLARANMILFDPATQKDPYGEDNQRQAILFSMISEILKSSDTYDNFLKIDEIIGFLIGRQDNINIFEITKVLEELNFKSTDLINKDNYLEFIDNTLELKSAKQLYNSEILMGTDPNKIRELPIIASLMGQRPILDGYITANVVHDHVKFRMLPSTLDILFSIGNDATPYFLENEINEFEYAKNLASLRYLINSYDEDFWQSNCYNLWLNSIKTLNPPKDRSDLPRFMQTAAWWQKTMNTQLASWAELRHDFLLYAKQPFSLGLICSYPHGYVEPVPEFYRAVISFFEDFNNLKNKYDLGFVLRHGSWINTCSTLENISLKILNNEEYSESENQFLCNVVQNGKVCSSDSEIGWYPSLYYGFEPYVLQKYITEKFVADGDKPVIADVHTAPTDEDGNIVGWVLHAATGNINQCVITTETPQGNTRTYTGPVSSYYEFVSNDFYRYTDEEWQEEIGKLGSRPAFTNMYLADETGNRMLGEHISLPSVWSSVQEDPEIVIQSYPNPFRDRTSIKFSLPLNNIGKDLNVSVYDLQGMLVKNLALGFSMHSNYTLFWDGLDSNSKPVGNGVYVVNIKSGKYQKTIKVIKQ